MSDIKYNVLIIGSGGREHALAWKIAQSPLLGKLYASPGNAGTAITGTNLGISENDFHSLRKAVLEHDIHLVIVGPEAPLVGGIVDYFIADPDLSRIMIIGPAAAGAQLEGSKDFAKAFMLRHNIPTAPYKTFHSGELAGALDFIATLEPPFVLKADGLAAGKGVIIASTKKEAETELNLMLNENKFGEAGKKVVIEKFLQGIELSVFVITDGTNYLLLPEAKDYKRIGENDSGPNTGGMGSVSPLPFAAGDFMKTVDEQIIKPTIDGLKKENIPYKGFIFFGLMKTGPQPYVIEYNARMGDPETEVVIPRIKNDLLELLVATANSQLHKYSLETDSRSAACVMMVAPGYPGSYPKGMNISGLDTVAEAIPFHAGTKVDASTGNILTNGGRILGITTLADDLPTALATSYRACDKINYEGKYYRTDIGKDVLADRL